MTRSAKSVSFVSSSNPLVSRSSRPTGASHIPASCTRSYTVGRPSGSRYVVRYPFGLYRRMYALAAERSGRAPDRPSDLDFAPPARSRALGRPRSKRGPPSETRLPSWKKLVPKSLEAGEESFGQALPYVRYRLKAPVRVID